MAIDTAWIVPAIGSPAIYAAVSIGDKLILTRTGIRLQSFYFFVGASQLAIAAVVIAVNPLPPVNLDVMVRAWGGGFIWGLALTLMFWVLRREEVSRVTPVWQSSPVFVALMAVVFLDERLGWAHWAAVGLVVLGAATVSYKGGTGGGWFKPVYGLLLIGALMIGIAQLLLKTVADDLSVWHSMALRGTGLFTSLALPYARPSNIAALARAMSAPRTAAALLATETFAPLFGNLLLLTALANGPVSLVSAVLGTRPVFVFIGTVGAGIFVKGLLEDRMTRADVVLKGASAAAVVAGVFLIALA